MHLGSCPKEIESSLDLWVGGRMGRVGWKGLFCFILLFENLNCARKERNAKTILILKNNPELNYNGAVNM